MGLHIRHWSDYIGHKYVGHGSDYIGHKYVGHGYVHAYMAPYRSTHMPVPMSTPHVCTHVSTHVYPRVYTHVRTQAQDEPDCVLSLVRAHGDTTSEFSHFDELPVPVSTFPFFKKGSTQRKPGRRPNVPIGADVRSPRHLPTLFFSAHMSRHASAQFLEPKALPV